MSACGVGVLVRTWTAMDCSGKCHFRNQVITIEDNEPPVLMIPADVSLDCKITSQRPLRMLCYR
ncbi:MAG: hypothetical protein R2788_21755 [Saprospiraceae bacterium]